MVEVNESYMYCRHEKFWLRNILAMSNVEGDFFSMQDSQTAVYVVDKLNLDPCATQSDCLITDLYPNDVFGCFACLFVFCFVFYRM